jgi:hypothetical protein
MEAKDGYRDVTLNVLFEAENGLKIIGEIQVCAKSVLYRTCVRRWSKVGGKREKMQCVR